jgi:hypothetical protein
VTSLGNSEILSEKRRKREGEEKEKEEEEKINCLQTSE